MKLNIRTLLVIVICLTSLSVIYQRVWVQLSLLAIAVVLLFLKNPSRNDRQRILKRLSNLGRIIITIMIFQLLFRREGTPILSFGFIRITDLGLQYGIASSLRFFLIIIVAGLLFDVPYYDFILAFKKWKIPFEISFLVATVIHFIPIFSKEFKLTMEALQLRGIDLNNLPLVKRPKIFLGIIFPVLAQAIHDIRYRTISLELRAFRLYPYRSYLYEDKLKPHDLIIQLSVIALFMFIIVSEVI